MLMKKPYVILSSLLASLSAMARPKVIAALSTALGVAGTAAGERDWGVAKTQDKGDGVTLTNVLHWYNSGNCVRDGWF